MNRPRAPGEIRGLCFWPPPLGEGVGGGGWGWGLGVGAGRGGWGAGLRFVPPKAEAERQGLLLMRRSKKSSKRAARRFFSGTARRQGARLFDGGMETRVAGSERGRPFFQGSLPTDEVENVENRREGAGFGAFMRGKATIDCGKLCEKWGKPLPNGWIYRM